jgi:hypothetical protein
MIGILFLALHLAIVTVTPARAATITVGPQGRDFTSIQAGIDSAAVAGDSVVVDAGDYVEELIIADKSLVLAAADSTQPPLVRPVDSSATVLRIAGAPIVSEVTVDGFIFRGGHGWLDSASMQRFGGAVAVTDDAALILRRCTADSSFADWGGGIAARDAGSVELERCVIDNCTAQLGGGGLYLDVVGGVAVDSLTVTDCDTQSGEGGGILVEGAAGCTLSGLVIQHNLADQGGGVAVVGGAPVTMSRSVLARNEGRVAGGGLYLAAATTVNFVTIDTCTAPQGAGVQIDSGIQSIRNTIISKNTSQGVNCAGGATTLDYNDIWGNSPDISGCLLGTGNISADPRYMNRDLLDYRLTSRSPAIDAADPAEPVPVTGGDRADLGAHEFSSGPEFIALESIDSDLLYKNSDFINFEVEWETDSTLTVQTTADFQGVDSRFDSLAVVTTPIQSGAPTRFRFRVSYQINAGNTAPDGDDILIPVTGITSLGGRTTIQVLAVSLDNKEPPAPTLANLPNTTTRSLLTVSGTVDVASGADSVSVLVNDVHQAGTSPDSLGAFATILRLDQRENLITAIALDQAGNSSSPSLAQSVDYISDFFIEFPKRFHAGDAFTIGSDVPLSRVEIILINLSGQLVRRLIEINGGILVTLPWDGRNGEDESVNAGPYIVRILLELNGVANEPVDGAIILVGGEGESG